MTQQIINIGTVPNDGTGDPLRTAFTKINGNYTELYSGVFAIGTKALTLVNGLNSDILSAAYFNRITGPSAAFSVGGFTNAAAAATPPGDNMEVWFYNSVSQTMTIVNEDASSTAANRIKTLTGANVVLQANAPSICRFVYCATETTPGPRWILANHQP